MQSQESPDLDEDIPSIFMSEVPRIVEQRFGFRPHRNTVRRWRTKGVSGAVLKVTRVGSRYLTSLAWIDEFLRSTDEGPKRKTSPEPYCGGSFNQSISRESLIAHERAMAKLRREGLAD